MASYTHNFGATRFNDVIWMYQKVTRQRYSTIYSVLVWDRHGQSISFTAPNKNKAADYIAHIGNRAPWILAGYDERINKVWKRNPQEIITAVDDRHKQFLEERRQRGIGILDQ